MDNQYKLVFDITTEPLLLKYIIFFSIGLIASVIAYKNRVFHNAYKKREFFFFLVYFVFMGTGLLLTLGSIIGYLDNKTIYEDKEIKVLIGKVEDFDPMPYGGRKSESFTIKGVLFEYTDFDETFYFNNTKSHGGPIKGNGQDIRIAYFTN